jgi:hypothetical protein
VMPRRRRRVMPLRRGVMPRRRRRVMPLRRGVMPRSRRRVMPRRRQVITGVLFKSELQKITPCTTGNTSESNSKAKKF